MDSTQDKISNEEQRAATERCADSPQVDCDTQVENENVESTDIPLKKEKRTSSKARLQEQVSELEQQNAELSDKILRTTAEYENFRKRTTKEKEDIFAFASAGAISAMLPVFDSLELALAAPCSDEEFKKGCDMILSQLATSMEKLGISEIKALGEQFDPAVHNAVMHDSDSSVAENTITQVLQKGYLLGDKVIRHAMVKVAN